MPQKELKHISQHRGWCSCIALVVRNSAIQFRLFAIQWCHLVADGAREIREADRAADRIQQKVSGCVIALFDRSRTQRTERPPALSEVTLRHTGAYQYILRLVTH